MSLAATGPPIWKAWNRTDPQTEDPEVARTHAIRMLERKLDSSSRWLTNLPGNPQFDIWLAETRNEFRPGSHVLSVGFDSRLSLILRAFDGLPDASGPLRDHQCQLALVAARSLLEEERNRLKECSAQREAGNERWVTLPPSLLGNGW